MMMRAVMLMTVTLVVLTQRCMMLLMMVKKLMVTSESLKIRINCNGSTTLINTTSLIINSNTHSCITISMRYQHHHSHDRQPVANCVRKSREAAKVRKPSFNRKSREAGKAGSAAQQARQ